MFCDESSRDCHAASQLSWHGSPGHACQQNCDKCGTIMTHRDVCGNAEMRREAWFMRETAETISSQQSHSREKNNRGGRYLSLILFCHRNVWSLYHFIDVTTFRVYFDNRKLLGCEMSCWFWMSFARADVWGHQRWPRLTKHPLHHHQGLDLWQFGSRRQFSSAYPTLELSEGRRIGQANQNYSFFLVIIKQL